MLEIDPEKTHFFVEHGWDFAKRPQKRWRLRGGVTIFACFAGAVFLVSMPFWPKEQPKHVVREFVRTAATLTQVKGVVQSAKACFDVYAQQQDKGRYAEANGWFCRVTSDQCNISLGAPAQLLSGVSLVITESDVGRPETNTIVRMMVSVKPRELGFSGVPGAQISSADFLARYRDSKRDSGTDPVMATYPAANDVAAVGATGSPDQRPVAEANVPPELTELAKYIPSLERLCSDPRFKLDRPPTP